MARVVLLTQPGGPEQLRDSDLPVSPPGTGEIRLRQTAIGVNYHDVYVRSGLYQTLPLPGVPGIEAVGVVEQVGPGVTSVTVGDRVGYVTGAYGCYAAERNLKADLAVRVPAELTDAQAAASLMKALTVCMLIRRVHLVAAGQTILVHAAAGGVGQLLCQWASRLGATVIGTVGSADKAAKAHAFGAAHTILYREEDVATRVSQITAGEGVAAAYDSVGADTFDSSMAALGFEGHLVNFGQSSGPVAPFSPSLLASKSLSVSRPIIFHYLRTRPLLEAMAEETFGAFRDGALTPIEPVQLPLSEAAKSHCLLEARQSPGGVVLIP